MVEFNWLMKFQPLPLDVHILLDLNRLMVDIVNLSLNAL